MSGRDAIDSKLKENMDQAKADRLIEDTIKVLVNKQEARSYGIDCPKSERTFGTKIPRECADPLTGRPPIIEALQHRGNGIGGLGLGLD